MNVGTLLYKLWQLRVDLEARDGRLHVDAPERVLTPELRAALAEHKQVILAALKAAGPRKSVKLNHILAARELK